MNDPDLYCRTKNISLSAAVLRLFFCADFTAPITGTVTAGSPAQDRTGGVKKHMKDSEKITQKFAMKNTLKSTNDDFDSDEVELFEKGEEQDMNGDPSQYNEIYRELAELVGNAAVMKIWNRYSGVSITFPRQLYSRAYIRKSIEENMGVMKPAEIARMVGLTERRVRQIIQEIRNVKKQSGEEP